MQTLPGAADVPQLTVNGNAKEGSIMADNDKVAIRGSRSRNYVAIHRIRPSGQRMLVGYYPPDEAEEIGLRIIREAGRVRERMDQAKAKLKAAA
jgi:hypothetical protein